MTGRRTAAACAGVAAIIASSVLLAQQPVQRTTVPGFPTEARVVVGNSQAEPVPVVLAAAGQLQPVTLVGTPTVSLADGAPVTTRAGSQRWEYRSVLVPADVDPADALRAPGQEGWEAVSALPGAGETLRVLLKRPS